MDNETPAFAVDRSHGENIVYIWYNPTTCIVPEKLKDFELHFYATYGSRVRALIQGDAIQLLRNPLVAGRDDLDNAVTTVTDFIQSAQINRFTFF